MPEFNPAGSETLTPVPPAEPLVSYLGGKFSLFFAARLL